MIQEVIGSLSNNSIVNILAVSMVLDTLLGLLRAIKEKKFNSTVGINGVIRKVAMLISVFFLMCVDCIMRIDMLFMIPSEYIETLGFEELGLCEFFSLIFILYETVSVLKNMLFCDMPIPKVIKNNIEKFLKQMTSEMDEN